MAEPNWSSQTIWTRDNLEVLRGMNSESVDLIYLDPPFNSKTDYAAPIGSKAAGAAFKDTWTLSDVDVEWINLIEAKHPTLYRILLAAISDSDKSYLAYMAARLLEMRRVLKSTGSIYLHCDPTMSHYLKLVMDAIFGRTNYLNEIVWRRSAAHNDSRQGMRRAGKVHDVILLYANGGGHTWNTQYTPYTNDYVTMEYRHVSSGGRRFKQTDLTAAKPGGDTSYEWRVKRPAGGREPWQADTTDEFRAPQAGWEYKGVAPYKGRYWAYSKDNMRLFASEGRLHHRKTGIPRLMQFADEMPGIPLQDMWDDISPALGEQRTNYPTQKPIDLLRRIVAASTSDGQTVLDPFCGCATACIAAEIEGRSWIGIDISPKAAELVKSRMHKELGLFYKGAHRIDVPHRTDLGKLPRYNSPANKKHLFAEQGAKCNGCGTLFEMQHFHVDHIIPRAKGGTDHLGNLQLLCGHCNSVKGDRGMEYLLSKLQIAA